MRDRGVRESAIMRRLSASAPFLVVGGAALYFAVFSLVRPIVAPFLVVVLVALGAACVRRLRAALVVWAPLAVYLDAFARLRSLAPRTGIPVQRTAFLQAERALFAGTVPAVWVQTHLRTPDRSRLLDDAAVAIHWSHFVVPVATLLLLWRTRPTLFRRYTLAFVVLTTLVLGCYFLCPAMPPWLAAREGLLPPLARPVVLVAAALNRHLFGSVYMTIGATNDVAAMPSLHAAYPFLMTAMFWPVSRRLGLACFAYYLLMSVALVYLAEHYVIDLLASIPVVLIAVRIAAALDVRLPAAPEHRPARSEADTHAGDITAAPA